MLKTPGLRGVAIASVLFLLVGPGALSASAQAWPQFHGTATHAGLSAAAGPRSVTLAWYSSCGSDVDSSPVVATDGTVYFSCVDGTLRARLPDGGEKWTFNANAPVYGSPVIGKDGQIILADSRGRL